LHQFHDEVEQVLAVLLVDARVEDADDVRVAQLAGERGIVLEELERAPRLFRVARNRVHHLDRDIAAGESVAREIHRTGRALAEQLSDLVFTDVRMHEERILTQAAGIESRVSHARRRFTPRLTFPYIHPRAGPVRLHGNALAKA